MEKSSKTTTTTVLLIIGIFLALIGVALYVQDKTIEDSPLFKSSRTFKSGESGVGTIFKNAPSTEFNKIIVSNATGDMNTIDRNHITANKITLTGDRNAISTDHIDGTGPLYVVNKGGSVISTGWGGNGNLTVEGDTTFKGGKAGGGKPTHFPYSDGNNYIRGDTNIEGNLNVNGDITIANKWILKYRQVPQGGEKDKYLFLHQIGMNYGFVFNADGVLEQRYNGMLA